MPSVFVDTRKLLLTINVMKINSGYVELEKLREILHEKLQ